MLIDNHSSDKRIYQLLEEDTTLGSFYIATGYFTIGALAFLHEKLNAKLQGVQCILGEIVHNATDVRHDLNLLNEEISAENAFYLPSRARKAVTFLQQNKIEVKTLEPNFCHAKVYLHRSVENIHKDSYYITGSANLTEKGLGLAHTSNVELNLQGYGSDANYKQLREWFDKLWTDNKAHLHKTVVENGKKVKIPFKEYLVSQIEKLFYLYTPYELYYKVLFELFHSQLDTLNDPLFAKQIGRLENTEIFKALYPFQQNGVISLIKMLNTYNGAILADAVGLGKTWTALAVMKHFQMQGHEVILICPKKLHYNWLKYKKRQGSRFEADGLDFLMRYHTDMQAQRMESYQDTDDKLLKDDKPKLFVIDESHNLRNDKSKRYQFLVEEILAKNESPKVLLLSATPINNSLLDIRNQFKLLVKGQNNGFFEQLEVRSLDALFRKAQATFNTWSKNEKPLIKDLTHDLTQNLLPFVDKLIVARTRNMIKTQQNDLFFPEKTKPINYWITPTNIGNYETFGEIFERFPPKLSAYQPTRYLETHKVENILEDEAKRDEFLVKMMYILLCKRLESSWKAFYITTERVLAQHQTAFDRIKAYKAEKKDLMNTLQEEVQLDLFEGNEMLEEVEDKLSVFTLGKKRKTQLSDIDKAGKLEMYRQDLIKDIEALESLLNNLDKFKTKVEKETTKPNAYRSEDKKLQQLISIIQTKRKSGANNHNPKILIFTTYKDTAVYLFEQLKMRGFDKIAMVSGDETRVDNQVESTALFEPILERFAPYTKLFLEKKWDKFNSPDEANSPLQKFEAWKQWLETTNDKAKHSLAQPIDILIATDTLSEGQNLQDCDTVINYDIHWNPVRIIQRVGRIDRLGSPNQHIFTYNFWPAKDINDYLDLQGRIEKRMASMQLVGSEITKDLTDDFTLMSEDDALAQRQNNRMLEQMQNTLADIDSEGSFGFDDLSFETFRQELFAELHRSRDKYLNMPKAVFTGFLANEDSALTAGIIALLGYPAKNKQTIYEPYKEHQLMYFDFDGNSFGVNEKEILAILAAHKHNDRDNEGLSLIDKGEATEIARYSQALKAWLKKQHTEELKTSEGKTQTLAGAKTMDLLARLKTGSKSSLQTVQQEGNPEQKYQPQSFDLVVWFGVRGSL